MVEYLINLFKDFDKTKYFPLHFDDWNRADDLFGWVPDYFYVYTLFLAISFWSLFIFSYALSILPFWIICVRVGFRQLCSFGWNCCNIDSPLLFWFNYWFSLVVGYDFSFLDAHDLWFVFVFNLFYFLKFFINFIFNVVFFLLLGDFLMFWFIFFFFLIYKALFLFFYSNRGIFAFTLCCASFLWVIYTRCLFFFFVVVDSYVDWFSQYLTYFPGAVGIPVLPIFKLFFFFFSFFYIYVDLTLFLGEIFSVWVNKVFFIQFQQSFYQVLFQQFSIVKIQTVQKLISLNFLFFWLPLSFEWKQEQGPCLFFNLKIPVFLNWSDGFIFWKVTWNLHETILYKVFNFFYRQKEGISRILIPLVPWSWRFSELQISVPRRFFIIKPTVPKVSRFSFFWLDFIYFFFFLVLTYFLLFLIPLLKLIFSMFFSYVFNIQAKSNHARLYVSYSEEEYLFFESVFDLSFKREDIIRFIRDSELCYMETEEIRIEQELICADEPTPGQRPIPDEDSFVMFSDMFKLVRRLQADEDDLVTAAWERAEEKDDLDWIYTEISAERSFRLLESLIEKLSMFPEFSFGKNVNIHDIFAVLIKESWLLPPEPKITVFANIVDFWVYHLSVFSDNFQELLSELIKFVTFYFEKMVDPFVLNVLCLFFFFSFVCFPFIFLFLILERQNRLLQFFVYLKRPGEQEEDDASQGSFSEKPKIQLIESSSSVREKKESSI